MLEQYFTGKCKASILRRPVKQALADLFLKAANSLADRGLRAPQYVSSTRKTLLAGYCHKNFQLIDIHDLPNITINYAFPVIITTNITHVTVGIPAGVSR